ncbi:MAG: hypothetical protein KJ558_10225 [Gammaproteobacteria bacterium]|nr:hypothetical protein [Gammaproteobacteria bacterium]MBU1655183.1 hypothetical protein [Gammaproteobacteria bacterium]MBU1959994.1 hypothetical protein [Gammaproteobacteria bacterium]
MKMKKRDLFATGKHIHEEWRDGSDFYRRILGEYAPNLSRNVIDLRLSNDVLTDPERQEFWLGWDSAA